VVHVKKFEIFFLQRRVKIGFLIVALTYPWGPWLLHFVWKLLCKFEVFWISGSQPWGPWFKKNESALHVCQNKKISRISELFWFSGFRQKFFWKVLYLNKLEFPLPMNDLYHVSLNLDGSFWRFFFSFLVHYLFALPLRESVTVHLTRRGPWATSFTWVNLANT
jgi:hypothetical protein